MVTPILFLGDSPSLFTGLGRIGRDIAGRLVRMPEFQVGYLGRGGVPSHHLPFMQYTFPEMHQWGEDYLEHVWDDFAGPAKGIIMTIWDPSRLLWFACPNRGLPKELSQFLTSGRFKRWGYFPVDAMGPEGVVTAIDQSVLNGYDRILGYTIWGSQLMGQSLGRPVDFIPHGFNGKKFQLRDKKAARMALGFEKDDIVVGCVMSNQARKDWGTAFLTAKLLKERDHRYKFWFHTDLSVRHWSFPALSADLHVSPLVTTVLNDEQLSYGYAACDCTFLPSLGEGFGFPIVESQACGVPCVHIDYAGGAELVARAAWRVKPVTMRMDGLSNCARPVLSADAFVEVIEGVIGEHVPPEEVAESVEHLKWRNLWPIWERWFREGLEDAQG